MHWSPLLLDEARRALVKTGRRSADEARVAEDALNRAAPGAIVPTLEVQSSFRAAWPGVNDAKDLHVAACAIALLAGAYYPLVLKVHLITRNAKDFAPKNLARLEVVQRHPDAFLGELWASSPVPMARAFRAFRSELPSRPAVEALLDKLSRDGQRRTATAMLRAHETAAHEL